MDAKALAKSKRAHSLHHKKKHQPHQALRAPSVGSDDKKPSGKQAKERPLQPHSQQANERPQKSHGPKPLPSNWERYNDNFDLGSEEPQPTEFVVPKSKGADYAYLISEAKAQSQVQYTPDAASLFDDFINDFTQDFGPMLAAKGKNMLSWIADDSFEFESQTSTSTEIPFLSLNLNALAGQFSKAKLSERLYLEPDLLPLELLDDELREYGEDKHDPQTSTSEAETDFRASSPDYNQEVGMDVQHLPEPSSSTINVQRNILIETFEEKGLKPLKQNTNEMLQSQGTNRRISPNSVSERIIDSSSMKQSKFESASAEAELDMLLSSLVEANTLDSSPVGIKPAVMMGNIDDDIDKLLQETSKFSIIENEGLSKGNIPSPVDPVSKSKLLDDFDSWLDTI
ncbi:hypothetical protein ACS0TY_032551 [Phlomoides rotata]